MKERPIIFSAHSVRAIFDGRKTQTRRVVKKHPFIDAGFSDSYIMCPNNFVADDCPHGRAGDLLWVRETFLPTLNPLNGERGVIYKADGADISDWTDEDDNAARWKSSMFMPRAASRLTLEITNIRVERLQSIPYGDVRAEGVHLEFPFDDHARQMTAYFEDFAAGWNALNAKRGFAWESNPFVWVIEFRKDATT